MSEWVGGEGGRLAGWVVVEGVGCVGLGLGVKRSSMEMGK